MASDFCASCGQSLFFGSLLAFRLGWLVQMSVGMTPPTVLAFPVILLFEGTNDILHGTIGWSPDLDIGKICRGIPVFHRAAKLDGTPEGLDIAEHLAAERPDASHPVAVPAPEQVITDEAIVLVAGEVDPFRGFVAGKLCQPGHGWIGQHFDESHQRKCRDGRRGHQEGKLIA